MRQKIARERHQQQRTVVELSAKVANIADMMQQAGDLVCTCEIALIKMQAELEELYIALEEGSRN
ncbi:MAG: hypothetical protein GX952_06510 [Firmicutes bacterium]|nr:hypothetical protein [Bacillota bacterium]